MLNFCALPGALTFFPFRLFYNISVRKRDIKDYNGKVAMLSDGSSIPTATLIWAAEVKGNKIQGLPKDIWIANDRILVDRYNRVEGFVHIFGDIAYMPIPNYPKAHP